ncbi:manganese-dependent inorganic pyrophosphatase [Gracilibacillus boraciitolerans JCM 21714]|uniref:Probable manganese-dependent inorganic pyrophosphatase n=1 Tax=Gracilibacillus boraciitolerans JCM 21714 TaxID=1298598 RepID=W4VE40_9BACI|nr:manganese-dependent inorganic pyrophosphatase [Gracilibacillus boraciitolerans]GAE91462.1 manganese-dependent inorganic pyrophosphatase [Gracilibacillus boraciitolerans JCM 21714]
MANTLIFGHKNPDTDTICSAIAYAELKRALGGEDVEAVRLGEVNNETQYALDQFNQSAPRMVENVSDEVDQVILVDHNERQQSAEDLDRVKVLEVIDHHRIANFETAEPLFYRAEPVGCTATILNKLYKEHKVEIKKEIAGLMLSGVISDTLLFKSPTCTDQDVEAAKELAEIADVDSEKYGLEMLKSGADLSDKSAKELITIDAKEFDMNGNKVEIAQVNTVDIDDVLALRNEIEPVIEKTVEEKGLKLFVLLITDILNNDSVVLAVGEAEEKVAKAFDVTLDNKTATLKGVVSRKKQVIPNLQKVF